MHFDVPFARFVAPHGAPPKAILLPAVFTTACAARSVKAPPLSFSKTNAKWSRGARACPDLDA
eukprot:7142443-Pyramimonas_sp.AAC.1